jgi:hypothetical protein
MVSIGDPGFERSALCNIAHASFVHARWRNRKNISRSSCTTIVNSFETCTAQTFGKSQSPYAFWQSTRTASVRRSFEYVIGSCLPAAGNSCCPDAERSR